MKAIGLCRYAISIALLGAGVLIFAAAPEADQDEAATVAFADVNVIDGTGAPPRRSQTVVVTSGRVVTVGDANRVTVPSNARRVEASGKYLIPGLWDLHVHTRYEGIDHLRLFVANGVTGVRDMGGPWQHLDVIKQWRSEIARGDRVGPRLVAAGALLDGPGSELGFSAIVNTPEEGRAAVRRLKDSGAQFVKVYDLLRREPFLAIVDEAKRQSLPVAGHPPLAVGVRAASDAGLQTVEHLPRVILASSPREADMMSRADNLAVADAPRLIADSRGIDELDRAKLADVAALLRRNRTVVVPTLSNVWTTLASTRKGSRISDRLRYVPPAYRAIWSGPGVPSDARFERDRDVVRTLHDSGVELLAGTDVVKAWFIPGFSLHDELSLLVSAGLSPTEALESATRKPPRLLGYTDVGTVEAGMRADLLLLDADPLQSIENTRRIAAVMTNGRLFDRDALELMLSDVEREAARWKGTPTDRFQATRKP